MVSTKVENLKCKQVKLNVLAYKSQHGYSERTEVIPIVLKGLCDELAGYHFLAPIHLCQGSGTHDKPFGPHGLCGRRAYAIKTGGISMGSTNKFGLYGMCCFKLSSTEVYFEVANQLRADKENFHQKKTC